MIQAPLELLATRHTPAPAPGLQLAVEGGRAFGLLTADEPAVGRDAHEAWARSITVHAYAVEGEPRVASRSLVGARRLLADPLPDRTDASRPIALPFTVDLEAWLGAGTWSVWATAREHASARRRVDLAAASPLDLPDPSPAEALLLARARLRAGRADESGALFAVALRDARLAADPDLGASFDAACAAARAGDATLAVRLLCDGLARDQHALAAALRAHVMGGLDGLADPLVHELADQEVARLRWLRDEEPDLASLRGTAGFAALFAPA